MKKIIISGLLASFLSLFCASAQGTQKQFVCNDKLVCTVNGQKVQKITLECTKKEDSTGYKIEKILIAEGTTNTPNQVILFIEKKKNEIETVSCRVGGDYPQKLDNYTTRTFKKRYLAIPLSLLGLFALKNHAHLATAIALHSKPNETRAINPKIQEEIESFNANTTTTKENTQSKQRNASQCEAEIMIINAEIATTDGSLKGLIKKQRDLSTQIKDTTLQLAQLKEFSCEAAERGKKLAELHARQQKINNTIEEALQKAVDHHNKKSNP